MALFNLSWPSLPLQTGKFSFDNGGPQLNAVAISTGTFTANGATPVVVANTAVTASSQIDITLKTAAGTISTTPFVTSITVGTGFSVESGASDTSIYNYSITG